ncbi:hypothetical protein BC833DRAFT_590663 [Globomyces pollinis-pini]|nr:hypothetical protein BC833DRAFT_590663 [Globomyces pollinis-pini]
MKLHCVSGLETSEYYVVFDATYHSSLDAYLNKQDFMKLINDLNLAMLRFRKSKLFCYTWLGLLLLWTSILLVSINLLSTYWIGLFVLPSWFVCTAFQDWLVVDHRKKIVLAGMEYIKNLNSLNSYPELKFVLTGTRFNVVRTNLVLEFRTRNQNRVTFCEELDQEIQIPLYESGFSDFTLQDDGHPFFIEYTDPSTKNDHESIELPLHTDSDEVNQSAISKKQCDLGDGIC